MKSGGDPQAELVREMQRRSDNEEFIHSFTELASRARDNSHAHGFHDARKAHSDEPIIQQLSDQTALMLIVSEIGEACEALRKHLPSDKIPDFWGVEEELADAIIRIFDIGATRNWKIAQAVVAKMKYNEGRPYLHGGKKV